MSSARRASGAVLAALGALGVTASAYLHWYADRDATTVPIDQLFQPGVATDDASSYWTSIAVVLAAVAVFGVIGALFASRVILTVGWLIGLAALALWVVMQAVDPGPDGFYVNDIQAGAWICAIALLVMLVGIVSMGRRERDVDGDAEPAPFTDLESGPTYSSNADANNDNPAGSRPDRSF